MKQRDPIRDDGTYNIIRTYRGQKTIFKERLNGIETRKQLKHWKSMARNAGGHVYFDAVSVPKEILASVA